MKTIVANVGNEFFKTEEYVPILFSREDYELRINEFTSRMKQDGIDIAVLYGDREHHANIEYFTGYDSRYEESLLIISCEGELSIFVGNEGLGASYNIPLEINRYLYQHLSLQGQPRDKVLPLRELFAKAGIKKGRKVGVCGIKYFDAELIPTDPKYTFDIPAYMLFELYEAADKQDVINYMHSLTSMPDGVRMKLRCAKEIAWAEMQGNCAASVMVRMYKNLHPGIREFEVPARSNVGFEPQSAYGIVVFGNKNVGITLLSPGTQELVMGEPVGLCYGVRGNLCAKFSIAAKDLDDVDDNLKPYVDTFYAKHFEAVCAWYERAHIGVLGADLYTGVMDIIGAPEFGVTLNPGHYTAADEWTNSGVYKDSQIPIADGALVQVDIIVSGKDPVRLGICEDAVVFAGEKLRSELKASYPECYSRIIARQQRMKNLLGINISDDVLPMGNLNGVYPIFALDTNKIFAKK